MAKSNISSERARFPKSPAKGKAMMKEFGASGIAESGDRAARKEKIAMGIGSSGRTGRFVNPTKRIKKRIAAKR